MAPKFAVVWKDSVIVRVSLIMRSVQALLTASLCSNLPSLMRAVSVEESQLCSMSPSTEISVGGHFGMLEHWLRSNNA